MKGPIPWILVLLATLVRGGHAQDMASSPPAKLTITETKEVPFPSIVWWGNPQCDAQGNLFFHATKVLNDPTILKADANGLVTLYQLPADEAVYFVAYRVSPEGKVWLLTEHSKDSKPTIYEFNKDPNSPTKTALDAPKGLRPTNFIVFKNGHFMLDGYFSQDAAAPVRGKGGLLEFDASGKLVRQSRNDLSEDLKDLDSRAPDSAAAQAEDGNYYLLRSDKVVVLSPDGSVVKRIELPPPEKGFHASDVAVYGGRVLVSFSKSAPSGKPLPYRYVLLDAYTGEVQRTYEPSDESGNNALCFSRQGLTFYRTVHGRRLLVTSDLR